MPKCFGLMSDEARPTKKERWRGTSVFLDELFFFFVILSFSVCFFWGVSFMSCLVWFGLFHFVYAYLGSCKRFVL